jgi:hypothetical protein
MRNNIRIEAIISNVPQMGKFLSGDQYCQFSIGWTGRRCKKKMFFNVYAYKKNAEPIFKSIKLKDHVIINGWLGGYISQYGKHYLHIVAEKVKIVDKENKTLKKYRSEIEIETDLKNEIDILADS